jgi:hypothetical protein
VCTFSTSLPRREFTSIKTIGVEDVVSRLDVRCNVVMHIPITSALSNPRYEIGCLRAVDNFEVTGLCNANALVDSCYRIAVVSIPCSKMWRKKLGETDDDNAAPHCP